MIQPAGRARNATYSKYGDPASANERQGEMKSDLKGLKELRSSRLTFNEKRTLTLREKEDRKLAEKYDRLDNPNKYRNWSEQPTMKASDLTKERMFQTAKSVLGTRTKDRDNSLRNDYDGEESPIRPLFMKSQNHNSIFDPNRIENLRKSQELSNKERTLLEKEAIEDRRKQLRADSRNLHIDSNRLSDILRDGPQPRGATVTPARGDGNQGEYSRKVAKHQFSIFDRGLEKLESKLDALTPGEQIAQNARNRRNKKTDRSFEQIAPARRTSDITASLFNKLSDGRSK